MKLYRVAWFPQKVRYVTEIKRGDRVLELKPQGVVELTDAEYRFLIEVKSLFPRSFFTLMEGPDALCDSGKCCAECVVAARCPAAQLDGVDGAAGAGLVGEPGVTGEPGVDLAAASAVPAADLGVVGQGVVGQGVNDAPAGANEQTGNGANGEGNAAQGNQETQSSGAPKKSKKG